MWIILIYTYSVKIHYIRSWEIWKHVFSNLVKDSNNKPSTYLWKTNLSFKTKQNLVRRMVVLPMHWVWPSKKNFFFRNFYIFANLFNVWLHRIYMGSHVCSVLSLLQYVFLVDMYEGNLVSHKDVVGKWKSF